MTTVTSISTEAAQKAHYAALKKKFYGRPANVNIRRRPAAVEVPAPKALDIPTTPRRTSKLPTWRTQDIWFDSHIKDFREISTRPMVFFITRRAEELGSSYAALTKKGKLPSSVTLIRDQIAAEYMTLNPETHWTVLARAFNRDHSAIYYGVHKAWADAGNSESRRKVEERNIRQRRHYHDRKEGNQ